jgi:DNA-binding NarL/FixJ family response regulator
VHKVKIILVDDHDILMDGIASILNEAPNLQVVGKASSVAVAQKLIQNLQPDLVLTDISMGDVSGQELTKYCLHHFPQVKIVVLSMHDSVQHISSLLEAGALGYLLKNVKQEELLLAIDSVMSGRQYIQQSLAGNYVRAIKRQQSAEKQCPLSPREIEIIRLIAGEFTTAQISKQLFLSEHTVETHRKNIGRKTGVKTVIGLINYAREHQLI